MGRKRLFSSSLASSTARLTLFSCFVVATLAFATRGSADATLKVDEANVKVLLAREPAQVLGLELLNEITGYRKTVQFFTPRPRECFPETPFRQPALTTNKESRAHAHVSFKLANNIGTWIVSVIGSNEIGEVGSTEIEIRAFQPFSAELDPPRVLTQGDRISLPVVLRNYVNRALSLETANATYYSIAFSFITGPELGAQSSPLNFVPVLQ